MVKNERVNSVDILKGLVMVLMAIDHIRVYSGISAGSQELGEFLTRWITHFCAPAFVFFAGTSIYFMGRKFADKAKLSKQLIIRGLLLVFMELTVLRFFWTFNLNITEFVLAGVIWMLGWCMVIMALLIRLKPKIVGAIGLFLVFFQHLFSKVPPLIPDSVKGDLVPFLRFIYPTGFENPREDTVVVLYVLVPWIGVMACGYLFGSIFQMTKEARKKLCVGIGSAMIVLFLAIGIYETNNAPESGPFLQALLSQQKYPASILFLMMTMGPLILAIPFLENVRNRFTDFLSLFGKVPLFYYIIHIPLIHVSALAVQLVTDGSFNNAWFDYAPFTFVPAESTWQLSTLYLVFVVDVLLLYFACKWYLKYKQSHPHLHLLRYI